MKQKSEALLSLLLIMNSRLKSGCSLKSIYDESIYWYGREDGINIFYEFAKTHKHEEDFMKEFNRTYFI